MSIPHQVTLQKPVVLLDALGKIAPFHLDFIHSFDALLAVLKIRFKDHGVSSTGLWMLQNWDFSLRHTGSNRPVDLRRPWATVFRPGQHVYMSMDFSRLIPPGQCPGYATRSRIDKPYRER
jgi:hypothetical protein